MKFLCRLFGHDLGSTHHYAQIIDIGVDGIRRPHGNVMKLCERCGKPVKIAMVHAHQMQARPEYGWRIAGEELPKNSQPVLVAYIDDYGRETHLTACWYGNGESLIGWINAANNEAIVHDVQFWRELLPLPWYVHTEKTYTGSEE